MRVVKIFGRHDLWTISIDRFRRAKNDMNCGNGRGTFYYYTYLNKRS